MKKLYQYIKDIFNINSEKIYDKRIYVYKLGNDYWYTTEVRRLGFLWKSRWKELTPIMQPNYKSAEDLFINYIQQKKDIQ